MFENNEFKVNISPDTFVKSSKTDSVFGEIYLSVNGTYNFPEKGWQDYIDIIAIWLFGASNLLTGKEEEWDCIFMDGSFQFTIKPQKSGLWKLSFINNRDSENLELLEEFELEPERVTDSLLNSAKDIIKYFEEQQWNTNDLENIKESYSLLEQNNTVRK
jgi:hypothetical protein